MPLQISRDRCRPADRLYFSGGGHAGLREPEGLWRVRQRQQTGWLERLADIRAVAGAAVIYTVTTTDHYQNTS